MRVRVAGGVVTAAGVVPELEDPHGDTHSACQDSVNAGTTQVRGAVLYLCYRDSRVVSPLST
jgi:hypothetical protein